MNCEQETHLPTFHLRIHSASFRHVAVEDVTSAGRLASWHWRRPLAAILSLAVVEACDACTWLATWNWYDPVGKDEQGKPRL